MLDNPIHKSSAGTTVDLSTVYGTTGSVVNLPHIVPNFIHNAPEGKMKQDAPEAGQAKKYVEENGGVFRGMQVEKLGDKRIGLVHFDVPPEQVGGKKNVTASIPIDKATPAGIRAKVAEMAAKHQGR